MGFPRQEPWSWFPFPSPVYLPSPGIELASPALAGRFFTTEPPGKPTMEHYSAIKKNEIISFASTWIDIEMIILNEVSQAEKGKYHMIFFICGI